MSELPYVSREPSPEPANYSEELRALYVWVDSMAAKITPAEDPRPGIKRWFKSDIPFGQKIVIDCDGNSLEAGSFQAELHDQVDGPQEVWELTFFEKATDHSPNFSKVLCIKDNGTYSFMLSPIEPASELNGQVPFVKASGEQVMIYYDDILYDIESDVRILFDGYDSIGYEHPDAPGQQADWEYTMGLLAEAGSTIPGIVENGKLVHNRPYQD